ncbi:DEAD/DEAH box helicase [Octadecabacter sp. R77987]|uniref:DEAD/DEAH box helicase n=1 Tax=Octadecabacter sp. R77987 TaxID=3093874 RepID=UPI003672179E
MKQTIAAALETQGYHTLTPVQEAVTAPELGAADLLVSAQTGSGKTVGFGLAIAPTLLGDGDTFDAAGAPLALVIAPTRELALQVKREFQWLYRAAGAVIASCVGGMDMRDERRALERGAHVVVATPGRLVDHIKRGSIDMGSLRAVVLDEADEMLDLGFREDLEFILSELPETRRTLMFSATVPAAIAKLAKSFQRDAVRVTTVSETSQHADIEYKAMPVAPRDAENAIINVLRYYDARNAIVFCNTRAMVARLTSRFSNRGFSVVALSGELTQNERTHALQAMRDGRARVCVATDVAARGIDLPGLELVVHAELPNNSDTLLHRSGRTGRAGAKGTSALIVPVKMRGKAERLLRFAKLTAEWGAPPSAAEVLARDEERLLVNTPWDEPVGEDDQEFVAKLASEFSASQLAAAFLRLHRERQSAPEELGNVEDAAKPRPRSEFGPSVWFSVNVGRDKNAEARWLLPLLCKAGGISKDDIGAIRIQQDQSYVEILKTSVDGFLARVGNGMELEAGTLITQLDKAPVLSGPPPRKGGGKPAYKPRDTDAAPRAKPARAPKKDHGDALADWKPKGDKPAGAGKPADKPRGKPGDKPKRDYDGKSGKPSGKPKGSYEGKPKGKFGSKSEGKFGGKPAAKGAPRADAAPAKRSFEGASDPSKRFTPPGSKPKGGKPGKPRAAKGKGAPKGGGAYPKRGK